MNMPLNWDQIIRDDREIAFVGRRAGVDALCPFTLQKVMKRLRAFDLLPVGSKVFRRQPRPQRRIARRPLAVDDGQHIAVAASASLRTSLCRRRPSQLKPSCSAARREATFIESHFHSSRR